MSYVAKWAALTAVCGEYVKASDEARQSVLGHIKAAPTIEEARRPIGPLKARLLKEIEVDASESAVKIDDLKSLNDTGTTGEEIKLNAGEADVKIDDLKAEEGTESHET